MTFWTNKDFEPYRKFRFQIIMGTKLWRARSVTKPSFDISENQYQLINHKFKYPGIVTWNDIDIVVIDDKKENFGTDLYNYLKGANYGPINPDSIDGFSKRELDQSAARITKTNQFLLSIEQLDSEGKIVERWAIYGPWIKAVKFGDLDYGADDLVEITMTIAYDHAEISPVNQ